MTRRTRVERLVAAGLAVAGAAVLVAALVRPGSPPEPPSRARGPSTTSVSPTPRASQHPRPAVGDKLQGPALPASSPSTLRVDRLGLRTPLVRLGVGTDGALEPPRRPEDVGWFTGSVTPGEIGPAVLAGHVTWNGAHAVFYRLGTLEPGDRVEVGRADGSTAVFEVSGVRRFSKADFPTALVYGPTERAVLRLITCGGRYDAVRHRYADNVVVFARLVGR